MANLNDTEFRMKLAELRTKMIIGDLEVKANPKKYLQEMSAYCNKLLKVLDEVEYALSPDIVFDVANNYDMRPMDIQGEAYIRCNKALEILSKYKREKYVKD